MRVKIIWTRDYLEEDNSTGHISVEAPTGRLEAAWSHIDGRGRLDITHNSSGLSEDQAYALLDTPALCQGIGTYHVTIRETTRGWDITEPEWLG